MPFRVGRSYTRQQIHKVIGGTRVGYLPHVGGRVVCGAFDPRLNPRAPEVVLVGAGPKVRSLAETVYRQGRPIPVFVKVAPRHWEYAGDFQPSRLLRDASSISRYASGSGRTNVTSVLMFTGVGERASLAVDSDADGVEGRTLMRLHRVRERNRSLVRAKRVQAQRLRCYRCEACGLQFDALDGLAGACCEVHHRLPLSRMGRPEVRTRLEDLALVCANCHRIIHGRDPILTVAQLGRAMSRGRLTTAW